MKAVVLAYHNVGCEGLRALLRAGIEVAAVFTHRDNPNENIWFESVAEVAAQHGISVFAPDDINHPLWVARIREMAPDALFSFYYRELVKPAILEIPPLGCFNLHGSLLPKYRGRVPINWAIINGESETGVTLHHMTPRPDDGDIVAQRRVPITGDDTARTVFDKCVVAARELLDETLPKIIDGSAPRIAQNPDDATYFGGRKPADGQIDWNKSAREVRNLIRAVTRPYPGAFTFNGDRKITVWQATDVTREYSQGEENRAGTILSVEPLVVACGENTALQLDFAESEQGVYQSGAQLAKELGLVAGLRFGARPTVKKGATKVLDSGRERFHRQRIKRKASGRRRLRNSWHGFGQRQADAADRSAWISF